MTDINDRLIPCSQSFGCHRTYLPVIETGRVYHLKFKSLTDSVTDHTPDQAINWLQNRCNMCCLLQNRAVITERKSAFFKPNYAGNREPG